LSGALRDCDIERTVRFAPEFVAPRENGLNLGVRIATVEFVATNATDLAIGSPSAEESVDLGEPLEDRVERGRVDRLAHVDADHRAPLLLDPTHGNRLDQIPA
jgi:hypothetical protein